VDKNNNTSIYESSSDRDHILRMFHTVQDNNPHLRYVTRENVHEIAETLKISNAEADGVLSFYRMFSPKPRGRYIIRLCDSLSCRISRSLQIYGHIRESLGIRQNETTPDGLFSLEIVNCLGNCDTAPNMMVNDSLYTRLTVKRVDEILTAYTQGVKL
jgi:NADH-quinone oxidoreductase subunit E